MTSTIWQPVSVTPVPVEEPSKLICSFAIADVGERRVLSMKVTGTYGVGSSGNADGEYLCDLAEAAVTTWAPHGVLFDLRGLSYVWGDMLEALFSTGCEERLPLAAITGPACHPALVTLLEAPPANDLLFASEADALAALDAQMTLTPAARALLLRLQPRGLGADKTDIDALARAVGPLPLDYTGAAGGWGLVDTPPRSRVGARLGRARPRP